MYPSEVVLRNQKFRLSFFIFDKRELNHQAAIGMALALVGDKVAQGIGNKLVISIFLHRLEYMWVPSYDSIHSISQEEIGHVFLGLVGFGSIFYSPMYYCNEFVKPVGVGAL